MAERTERSDEELMVAYRRGERVAFRALFERYAPRLLRSVRRHVPSEQDAQEIVQQTFLQLHRARHDYSPKHPLRPWIFTICFNLRREHFRRKKRKPETALENAGPEPQVEGAPDYERMEGAAQVRAAVAALPASQREVIELHWFEELTFPEVAQVVGATVSAVKVRAHRGYERLRSVLGTEASSAATSKGPSASHRRR